MTHSQQRLLSNLRGVDGVLAGPVKGSAMRYWQRRSPLPSSAFPGGEGRRIFSLCLMLLVLGMVYRTVRDPDTWAFLVGKEPEAEEVAEPEKPVEKKPAEPQAAAGKGDADKPVAGKDQSAIPGGPIDTSEGEWASAEHLFQAVTDRHELQKMEMPAQWKLFKWSRAQTLAQLEKRAQKEILYTRYFEEPEKYRGKLVWLRVHIKRILEYDAPKNSAGVKKMYEIWGWTDDSKSYYYVMLTDSIPPGFKTGADITGEGVFAGYFFKTMAYTAFDKQRWAPLMVGQIRSHKRAGAGRAQGVEAVPMWLERWVIGGAAVVMVVSLFFITRKRPVRPKPVDDNEVENWLAVETSSGNPHPQTEEERRLLGQ